MQRTAISQSFGVDTPLSTIQAIRLCHSLLESNFDVYFPADYKPILKHLSKWFSITYELGLENASILDSIVIEHDKPLCRIGNHIERTLIFPHAVVERCQRKWKHNRSIDFSFCGLVTKERKHCLEEWISTHFEEDISIKESKSLNKAQKAFSHLINKPNIERQLYKDIGLCIFTSDAGRRFPIKAWDDGYYNLLADSHFVLCPSGDFVWTYRFFEAILCGAIPIVETTCPHYQKYNYFLMSDSSSKLTYSNEIVEHNFQVAKEMLTIPLDELNQQIAKILEHRS